MQRNDIRSSYERGYGNEGAWNLCEGRAVAAPHPENAS
ncbi:hypothetical protein CYD53_102186 [Bosea psychrotolerans]|uniref:Uncharacterized protein n=1 Tax=Bosea psychrotolerans TaxID=1871628 RepID=A0A2S4MKN3_9HYPH|nr:hypothetical protein CYD53_102186 [Bosea psychrotolerans]